MSQFPAIDEQARAVLGIELPCSRKELRNAYYRAARALHTDTGGDARKFQDMKAVYETILGLAESNPSLLADNGTRGGGLPKTVDGTYLHELGLGLGPSRNGIDCPECGHDGYTSEVGESYRVCTACNENGNVVLGAVVDCIRCGGGGKVFQKDGCLHRCRDCGGTGKSAIGAQSLCGKCRGSKTIWSGRQETFYKKCHRCDGTGEVIVFNPVAIKGALTA